jgi:hypothetical protein
MQGFAKGFGAPDVTTTFPNGCEDVVDVQGSAVGRLTLRPGWRWSNDVRPLKGWDSCIVHHMGYCLSGSLHVEMDDGTTLEIGPGDLYVIRPGHDAWVVGSVDCIMLDWSRKVAAAPEPEPIRGTR